MEFFHFMLYFLSSAPLYFQSTKNTKRYDGIWGSMAITDQRLEVVDFTDPYYISGAQLVVREGSQILGPQSLQ